MRNKYATHVDFTFLSELAGKRLPSNLDMIAERKGRFLVGEWKRVGEQISLGQSILLKELARLPQFRVLVIIGHSDNELVDVGTISEMDAAGELVTLGSGVNSLKAIYINWLNERDKLV